MAVHTRATDAGRAVQFTIFGALDDGSVDEVLTQCRRLPRVSWDHLEVKLVSADHLDLNGLELLLLLRERSRERQSLITLVECSPEVRRLLDMSGLRHHFLICEGAGAAV